LNTHYQKKGEEEDPKHPETKKLTASTGLITGQLTRQMEERLQWRQTVHSAANPDML